MQAVALPGGEAVLGRFDAVGAWRDEGEEIGAVGAGDGFEAGVGGAVDEYHAGLGDAGFAGVLDHATKAGGGFRLGESDSGEERHLLLQWNLHQHLRE